MKTDAKTMKCLKRVGLLCVIGVCVLFATNLQADQTKQRQTRQTTKGFAIKWVKTINDDGTYTFRLVMELTIDPKAVNLLKKPNVDNVGKTPGAQAIKTETDKAAKAKPVKPAKNKEVPLGIGPLEEW